MVHLQLWRLFGLIVVHSAHAVRILTKQHNNSRKKIKQNKTELRSLCPLQKSNEATKMADEQEPPVFQPQVVLPGEDLSGRIGAVATEVKLGRGIDHRVSRTDTAAAAAKKPSKAAANVAPSITATKAGVFRFRPKNRFWVENNQKR